MDPLAPEWRMEFSALKLYMKCYMKQYMNNDNKNMSKLISRRILWGAGVKNRPFFLPP